jgi:amino acid transporter
MASNPPNPPIEPDGPIPPIPPEVDEASPSSVARLRRVVFGAPRDIFDRSIFHRLALVPFLAWVGLGADGLSSSCYGPSEAFQSLESHRYLAVALALAIAATVFVISSAYRGIIEQFPHGGGGYLVATKLLGPRYGVVSGSALLVDYVLTIAVSIAAAADALFSLLPPEWQVAKLPAAAIFIVLMTTINIRGVRESVIALLPIFFLFLVTHLVLIVGGFIVHLPAVPQTVRAVSGDFRTGLTTLGVGGMLLLFMRAYSMGAGTYTGLEAVSNGLPIMREPQVHTGRRTMVYMATSLAFTAGGLLVLYLLWNVSHEQGKTLNAVLAERFAAGVGLGFTFVILTLVSEGALLAVGAQAGFIDGPRVLANMAVDSWMPHRFAALSERLTTQNGIVLMGVSSLAALLYTRGDVRHLVVMYSINVFLTFSLSMFGMAKFWLHERRARSRWKRSFALFAVGFALCVTILAITIYEKFLLGGWVTLIVTGAIVAFCFRVRGHYGRVGEKLRQLYSELGDIPSIHEDRELPLDPKKPTAAILVGSYGGLGIHTVLNAFRAFPGHFKNVVFLSVGVVDSGEFKGEGAIEGLRERTEKMLGQYLDLARGLRIPANARYSIGTDAIDEAEKLCLETAKEFPHITFFAGKIIFRRESWYQPILHNETAAAVQKRLQWKGRTMVILPARVR